MFLKTTESTIRAAGISAALFVMLVIAPGCQSIPLGSKPGTEINPLKVATHDDIVDISCWWKDPIWIQEEGKVVGFRVPTYFISAKTGRGVFVPGTVRISVFHIEPKQGGGLAERTLVHKWEMPEDDSKFFRQKKVALGGYVYGFMMVWPDELELWGKLIEIDIEYERLDGRIIRYPASKMRKVPTPMGYRPEKYPGE